MIVFSIHRSWRIISAGSQHILAACQCGKFLPDPVLEFEAVLHVVRAEQVVDDLQLGDIIGAADVEVLHVVSAEELAGGTFPDAAQHGPEFIDRHHVREGQKSSFVILSCHDCSPSFIHVIARPVCKLVVVIRNPLVERTDSHTSDTVTGSK